MGAFREGKSFLLNFFLKYLTLLEVNSDSKNELNTDWTHGLNEAGFEWKSSSNGCTQGLLIWSKPFIVKCLNENRKEEEVHLFAFFFKFQTS